MRFNHSTEYNYRPFFVIALRSLVLTIAAFMVLGCTCSEEATPSNDTAQEKETIARSAKKASKNKKKKRRKNKKKRSKRNEQSKLRSPGNLLIRSALKRIEMTDDQRAQFDKMRKETRRPQSNDLAQSRTALYQKLVSDTAAGSIDARSYDSYFESIEKAKQDQFDVQRELLSKLHALLGPEQRKALSDTARLRQAKYMMKTNKKAETCTPDQDCPKSNPAKAKISDLERFTTNNKKLFEGLQFTPEQQTKIDELTNEISSKFEPPKSPEVVAEEETTRFASTFKAFEEDTLDPNTLSLEHNTGLDKWDEMKIQIEYLAGLLVLLTPDQQQLVAEKLKKRFQRKARPKQMRIQR